MRHHYCDCSECEITKSNKRRDALKEKILAEVDDHPILKAIYVLLWSNTWSKDDSAKIRAEIIDYRKKHNLIPKKKPKSRTITYP